MHMCVCLHLTLLARDDNKERRAEGEYEGVRVGNDTRPVLLFLVFYQICFNTFIFLLENANNMFLYFLFFLFHKCTM